MEEDIIEYDLENLPPFGSPEREKIIKDAQNILIVKRHEYDKALDFAAKVKHNECEYNKKYVKIISDFDKDDITYMYVARSSTCREYGTSGEYGINLNGMGFNWYYSSYEDATFAHFSWWKEVHVKLDKLHTIKEITEEEFKSKFNEMRDGMKKKFDEYLKLAKKDKL